MGLLGKLEGFGKALWGTGKGVVDVVGDVAAVVDGAGAVGDFITRVGKAAKLDDVVEAGGRLAGWAKRIGLNKFLRAADSPILDGGQLVIAGMKLTTGIGEPEDGERFGRGGQRWHNATATLRSAQPTADWSGAGASSYATQNTTQSTRTNTVAAADHEVHRVVAAEAYQVTFHRDRLDDWHNWLADVGLVTFALGLIPEVGQALKAAAEAHAVMAAVGSSAVELYQLSSEAQANAAALKQLVGRYDDVARTAKLSQTGPDQDPPPPPPPLPPPAPADETPSDGPADEPSEHGPQPPPDQTPGASAQFVAPMPTSGGTGSAGGGGSPAGGEPAPVLPVAPTPAAQESSDGGGVPAALGALPAAVGGVPAGMAAGATPMAAASGIPAGLIKEAVQAALQREAQKRAEDDELKDKDGDGNLDEGRRPEDEKPHDEKKDEPEAAPGGIDAGRAPVHIELDVDVERLRTPFTVTLDRESPTGPSPTPTP